MRTWTVGEIKDRVIQELDLEGEDFITDAELNGYIQSAINEAVQEVVKLYEKYFETEAFLPLVSGTSVYDYPSDIWGTKVTLIQYDNGSQKYPIKRIRDLKKIAYIRENDVYCYRPINNAGDGPQIKIYPTPNETSSENVVVYYLRTPSAIVNDSSIVDVPEASNFIIQHVKDSCAAKESGSMYSKQPSVELEKQRELLQSTLSDMIPDGDNTLEGDFSFYEEFDSFIEEF